MDKKAVTIPITLIVFLAFVLASILVGAVILSAWATTTKCETLQKNCYSAQRTYCGLWLIEKKRPDEFPDIENCRKEDSEIIKEKCNRPERIDCEKILGKKIPYT